MKIYDKKMFWQRILCLFVGVVLVEIIGWYSGGTYFNKLYGFISVAIVTFREISITLSEEKLREHKIQQHFTKLSREKLFGKKDKIIWTVWIVLMASTVLVLKFSLTLSVALFAVSMIYILWYCNVVENEAKKLRAQAENIELVEEE